MTWFGTVMAFWISVYIIWPESLGRLIANVRKGYDREMDKEE